MRAVTDAPPAHAAMETGVAARAYGKVFLRIVPFLMLCYVVAYLDRVNVGFAKLQMTQELKFSDTVFGLGAGIFFLGYFFFEVPSNLILHRVGARVWIARIMISWGIVSASFVFVSSETMFYVLRFLLGAAEAGFFPGIILYLTYWYPSHRRARAVASFMSAVPVASIFGNPLSGWILDGSHRAGGWSGWQWLFLIEAVPALILGIVTLFYLDNGIRSAAWLDEDEKQALEAAIAADNEAKTECPAGILEVFKDGWVWLMCLIYFCFVLGLYGLNFWMPTLVQASGVTGNFNIGLVSAIPYIVTLFAMLALGRHSDYRRERRWHLAVPAAVSAIGFVVAANASNTAVAIAALSIAAAGTISCTAVFWPLPAAILAGAGAAAGIAWINSVGNLAGFAGPYLVGFLNELTGSNVTGMYVLAGALILGAIAALSVPSRLSR
jgi:D-galactonate transporter